MGKREYTELFGKDWKDARPLGLVKLNGQTALLKVKSSWTNGEFTCSTGYFLMCPAGLAEIAKTDEQPPKVAPADEANGTKAAAEQTAVSPAPLAGPPAPFHTRGIALAAPGPARGANTDPTESAAGTAQISDSAIGGNPEGASPPLGCPTPIEEAPPAASPTPKAAAKAAEKAVPALHIGT